MKNKDTTPTIHLPKHDLSMDHHHDHLQDNETCCGDCQGKDSCLKNIAGTFLKDTEISKETNK